MAGALGADPNNDPPVFVDCCGLGVEKPPNRGLAAELELELALAEEINGMENALRQTYSRMRRASPLWPAVAAAQAAL